MKILVCGGRHYNNRKKVFNILDHVHSTRVISSIVHGDATGADTLAKEWAIARGVEQLPYPARWEYGTHMGPIRNTIMIVENQDIEMVIAFPGDVGTADMIKKARRNGLLVETIEDG